MRVLCDCFGDQFIAMKSYYFIEEGTIIMWKILKSSIHNRIIAAVFSLIFIVNLYALLSVNDVISRSTNELLTTLSIPVSIILVILPTRKTETRQKSSKMGYFGLLKKGDIDFEKGGILKSANDNCENDIKNEVIVLKRQNHRKNIVKKVNELFKLKCDAKGLIITGESGSGKTILLGFLENDLTSAGYEVCFNNEYHILIEAQKGKRCGVPSEIESDKKYVLIFDQFEGYLDFNDVEDWIYKNKGSFKNCVFVFSFPQKFLTGVYNKMYGKFEDFNLITYVLYLDKNDEDEYLTKIAGALKKDKIFVDKKWTSYLNQKKYGTDEKIDTSGAGMVLLEELYNVKCGYSPLIEMEFLGRMVEESYGGQDITRKNFIEYKFDKWAKRFEDEETAYAVLALFTRFKTYGIEDIKLITFDPANKFDKEENGEIIEILESTDFLIDEEGCTQFDGKASNNRLFTPKHEYICGAIQTYLATKEVPTGIRNYVEYYRSNARFKEYKNKIIKRYEKYNESHMPINVLLYVMLSVIFLYNVLCTYSGSNNLDIILHRGLFTCISFCSVFYIYNYCNKIMWIGNRVAAIATGFLGLFTVIWSYVRPSWWGVYLGSEIIIFSLCVGFCLAVKTTKKAFKNLLKDSIIFLAIGISVLLLGIVFIIYFTSTDEQFYLLKFSYYPLFIVYVLMSDINHIKAAYIKNKIGYINMSKTDN